MTAIFARQALLPGGWHDHVRIEIEAGKIAAVTDATQAEPTDTMVDTLLPALSNLHSHSFQRAMAGMTEQRGAEADSFWTWRDVMYRFLQHLTPDDIEAIAAFAFMEMQEAGFVAVAEFHYLHHAAGGVAYDNRAELAVRIMSAAEATGIGLTLLPVLYTYAGLGKRPLEQRQLRFGNSLDDYLALHGAAAAHMQNCLPSDARMGAAPHSLRAVSGEDLAALSGKFHSIPFHLHIAEQTAELDEVKAAMGQTPVAWLLDHANVDRNWCLVHATHMTDIETKALASTGAVAGLCPLTEANLGDGVFAAKEYLAANGAFGIGSDSNINITVAGELAMLEYGQRLRDRKRNVLGGVNSSTGTTLYLKAAEGGAKALGRNTGTIAIGHWADLVAIDSNSVANCALKREQMLDGWIFASNTNPVTDLWSAGRHKVRNGHHVARETIAATYKKTVMRVAGLL
jgi:formimidoylglutamate deiminase